MADKYDCPAVHSHASQRIKKLRDLRRCEHRRGLVKNKYTAVTIQQFEDFYSLSFSHGKIADNRIRVHVQAVACGEFPHAPPHAARIDNAGFLPQQDILGYAHSLHQHEMLVDHADACGKGVFGRTKLHRKAVHTDAARVRTGFPGQNGHKRGFARAVFAHQRLDPRGTDVQGNVVIGFYRAETLADAFEPDNRPDLVPIPPVACHMVLFHHSFSFLSVRGFPARDEPSRCAPSSGRSSMNTRAAAAVITPTAMNVACRA